jgi:isopentenyl-diphosphate delta-isomerase
MMRREELILVDNNDAAIGTMEKLEAHRIGALHRAFSVVLYNARGEMLIQKRAPGKYHSPNLWSNSCCSHPRPGEATNDAVKRRLREELGLEAETRFHFRFEYRVDFGNGLIEHEMDHVYVGHTDQQPVLNPKEISDYAFVSPEALQEQMQKTPDIFTYWFHLIMQKLYKDAGIAA